MINKIIGASIFFFMIIAILLHLGGVSHVEMSVPFRSFLATCNQELNTFKIGIPNIPFIPVDEVVSLEPNGKLILDWFISFARGFFDFINFLITIINILSTIINTLIQLIQFLYIFLKNLITLKESLISQGA